MSSTLKVSKTINASPQAIFEVIANPHRHQELDGSGTIKGIVDGPQKLELGSKFAMSIQQGVPYRTYSKVIEYKENELIAWTHIGKHVWKYELEKNGESTIVTQSWDFSICPSWEQAGLRILRYPARNRKSMEITLEKLAKLVE